MIKTIFTAASLVASAAVAGAQPLPAPPTVKYDAPTPSPCAAQTLQVYFPSGGSELTAASQAVLQETQDRLSTCIIGPVSIAAKAADAPSVKTADRLAQARIDTVIYALDQHRLAGAAIATEIEAAAPAHYSAPQNRKVEIRLSAWSPKVG